MKKNIRLKCNLTNGKLTLCETLDNLGVVVDRKLEVQSGIAKKYAREKIFYKEGNTINLLKNIIKKRHNVFFLCSKIR